MDSPVHLFCQICLAVNAWSGDRIVIFSFLYQQDLHRNSYLGGLENSV